MQYQPWHGIKPCLSVLINAGVLGGGARATNSKLYPHIKHPEVVAPITIHPAFEKAASYFDLKMVHVGLDEHFNLDLTAYRRAITRNTILLVASAPQYCYGVR